MNEFLYFPNSALRAYMSIYDNTKIFSSSLFYINLMVKKSNLATFLNKNQPLRTLNIVSDNHGTKAITLKISVYGVNYHTYSKFCQTSKMELFVKIVNSFCMFDKVFKTPLLYHSIRELLLTR